MSYKQNAGQSNIKISNKSFERVQQFKYFGRSLTMKIAIKKIKSRLESENACHHSL